MNLKEHEEWFELLASRKITEAGANADPLRLKLLHTRHVLNNARTIAAAENLAPELAHACHLAALYHDLARFDQYLQFGTFRDSQSRNHGAWAVKLLKQYKRLDHEPANIKRAVLAAIGLHNRKSLPPPAHGMSACLLVRDADKIDITRVMDEHLSGPGPYNPTVVLGLPDDPELASPKVIACAMAGQSASYEDLLSVNDFRVLLGLWHSMLHFESSRQLLVANGHALNLVAALPASGPYAAVREKLLRELAPAH